jgi:RNA polymerase sigma-70 factor (ECF subfamily)
MTRRSSERDPAGSGSGGVPLAADAIDHLDSLYRGAPRLTRNRARAEDLVRDTYVRALRFHDCYRSGTSVRGPVK